MTWYGDLTILSDGQQPPPWRVQCDYTGANWLPLSGEECPAGQSEVWTGQGF